MPASQRIENDPLGRVVAVCTSRGGIPKLPRISCEVETCGLAEDGHAHAKHNTPLRAVSLWDLETLRTLNQEGFQLAPGATGENLVLEGVDLNQCLSGTCLRIGDVLLRLEQARKPCYVMDAIDPALQSAVTGRFGFLASVIRGGLVAPSMAVHVVRQSAALAVH